MKEDECRLTYMEGKKIEKDVYAPYSKKADLIIAFGFVFFIIVAGLTLLSMNTNHFAADTDDLDELLASGEISEGFYEYERKSIEAQSMMFGLAFFLMTVTAGLAIGMIGDIERKKALREANDRKWENAEDETQGSQARRRTPR